MSATLPPLNLVTDQEAALLAAPTRRDIDGFPADADLIGGDFNRRRAAQALVAASTCRDSDGFPTDRNIIGGDYVRHPVAPPVSPGTRVHLCAFACPHCAMPVTPAMPLTTEDHQ